MLYISIVSNVVSFLTRKLTESCDLSDYYSFYVFECIYNSIDIQIS